MCRRSHLGLPCSLLEPHPCPGLLSPAGNPEDSQEKAGAPAAPAQSWSLGHVQQGGPDNRPPPFLPYSIFPYVFFNRDHKGLRYFPASLEVSILLQVFCPVTCEAQPQMSKPLRQCLPDTIRTSCVSHQTSYIFLYIFYIFFGVSSFYILFGLSFIPKWIFQLISHLLYLPPPLAHFSSSVSSCLFSFFSYNSVHLDNFHLDCLT